MDAISRLMDACREGPEAAAALLGPGFTFEAGDVAWDREAFLGLVGSLRAAGGCLDAEGVSPVGDGSHEGLLRAPNGALIPARFRLDGDRVAGIVLDALPGALEHLRPEAVAATARGERPDRPGALAAADAPMRKVDPANVGARVEAIKRMQDRQAFLQRPEVAQRPGDPLDRQSEMPRGPAHEGGWSRDQGEEQSGSSLDEEPNTRADGTTTPGSYDGGRRSDPPAAQGSGKHRQGGRSRS